MISLEFVKGYLSNTKNTQKIAVVVVLPYIKAYLYIKISVEFIPRDKNKNK